MNDEMDIEKMYGQDGDIGPNPRISVLERDLAIAQRDLAAALAERDAAFEMSRCECGTDEACANLARLNKERDEARAEAAALRVDAERYRWLRKQDPNRDRIQTDESQSTWVHVKGVRVDCMSDALYVTSDYATMGSLDAAIDAAKESGNG